MKKAHVIICSAAMISLIACTSKTEQKENLDDDKKNGSDTIAKTIEDDEPAQKLDSAEMMKRWQEFMTPGEMHKMLAMYDGTFEEDITMWMDPAAPPSKSKAVVVNKMIFGGLYQHSTHKGSFDGMPFEGISTMGYDNAKKKFVSTWIDNMGSGIMLMEGDWDENTKTVTLTGKMTDPMTGKDCDIREIMTFTDANTQTFEMFVKSPGEKEFKTMEGKFTRKK